MHLLLLSSNRCTCWIGHGFPDQLACMHKYKHLSVLRLEWVSCHQQTPVCWYDICTRYLRGCQQHALLFCSNCC
jgi:hypothetical protein